MTRPDPSTTGNALIRDSRILATISLNEASLLTATTADVITSLTMLLIARSFAKPTVAAWPATLAGPGQPSRSG